MGASRGRWIVRFERPHLLPANPVAFVGEVMVARGIAIHHVDQTVDYLHERIVEPKKGTLVTPGSNCVTLSFEEKSVEVEEIAVKGAAFGSPIVREVLAFLQQRGGVVEELVARASSGSLRVDRLGDWPDDYARRVAGLADGTLIVGGDKTLMKWTGDRWVRLEHKAVNPYPHVGKSGQVWIATEEAMTRLGGAETPLRGVPRDCFVCICAYIESAQGTFASGNIERPFLIERGVLWWKRTERMIGRRYGIVFRLDGDAWMPDWTTEESLWPTDFAVDASGELWGVGYKFVMRRRGGKWHHVPRLETLEAIAVASAPDGTIFLAGTKGSLFRLRGETPEPIAWSAGLTGKAEDVTFDYAACAKDGGVWAVGKHGYKEGIAVRVHGAAVDVVTFDLSSKDRPGHKYRGGYDTINGIAPGAGNDMLCVTNMGSVFRVSPRQ